MTRVEMLQQDSRSLVSSDANFVSDQFPSYLIGADSAIVEAEDGLAVPSLKEIVAKEAKQLIEQRKRLSVRDIAKKFEEGLITAAMISEEARWKDIASLDRHVLLRKLKELLESLRGRVAGRNKDDAEEAISVVEALAVQLTQKEGELIQEKSEIKRLGSFFKQATEDAKKVVEEERAIARAEIESARGAISRVEKALEQQELISRDQEQQSFEELKKEVQEARRIKMLHQPSKVMDMEHEIKALRIQLADKSLYTIRLKKELEMYKSSTGCNSSFYELDGPESLGSSLRIIDRCSSSVLDISNCSIQWFRVLEDRSKKEVISGATKPSYAPEPSDVGKLLQVEFFLEDQMVTLATTGPIDPAAGLDTYVEALVKTSDIDFNVVVLQVNGQDHRSSIHVFQVTKSRIKLSKGKTIKAKESYSTSMQLCGVRGGGNAASRSLFWQAKKNLSYTLAFESERERNAAIMLARRFAFDCNILLMGPDEPTTPAPYG